MPSLAIENTFSPNDGPSHLGHLAENMVNFRDLLQKFQEALKLELNLLHDQVEQSHYLLAEGQTELINTLYDIRSDLAPRPIRASPAADPDNDDGDRDFNPRRLNRNTCFGGSLSKVGKQPLLRRSGSSDRWKTSWTEHEENRKRTSSVDRVRSLDSRQSSASTAKKRASEAISSWAVRQQGRPQSPEAPLPTPMLRPSDKPRPKGAASKKAVSLDSKVYESTFETSQNLALDTADLVISKAALEKEESAEEGSPLKKRDSVGSQLTELPHEIPPEIEGERHQKENMSELSQIVRGHIYNGNWIEKRPGFQPVIDELLPSLVRETGSGMSARTVNARSDRIRLDEFSEYVEIPTCCMAFNPDKPFRTFLDIIAILMLLHDAIMVPYLMAWNVSDADYQPGIWATRIFWTVDLPFAFFTGYRRKIDQRLEVRIIPAMKHYLRTWFVPDVSLVLVDWLGYFLKDLAFIRSALRVFRLLRAFSKIPRAADLWARMVLASEKKEVQLMMGIFRMMFVILWFNHVISCGWYAIGKYSSADTDETWVVLQYQQGALYEYTTALHWALTQMSPASMEVVPRCSEERIYTVAVIFFGLIVGSTLIATMSSIMTQYRLQLEERTKKFLQLQQFLTQQDVRSELCKEVKRYVRVNLSKKTMLKRRDVVHLKELPKAMQQDLNWFLYSNIIHNHPFINPLGLIDHGEPLRALCNNVFAVFDCRAGDYLFEEGTEDDNMFFVAEGKFKYIPGEESVEHLHPQDGDQLELKRGDWCCEPALWTLWTHLGNMYVTSMAEVLYISAAQVQKELAKYPSAMSLVCSYCSAFHQHVNQVGVALSDLPFRYDYTDILCTMEHDDRVALSMSAIEHHRQNLRSKRARARNIFNVSAGCERLIQEVQGGMCHVTMVGSDVERAVSVAALRLGRPEDTRFLVNIGQFENHGTELATMCQLPGVKKRRDEILAGSLKRLIDTELRSVAKHVEIFLEQGSTRTSLLKDSTTYGIKTRYARSTFYGKLNDDSGMTRVKVTPEAHRAASGINSVFDVAMSPADYELKKQILQVLGTLDAVYIMEQDARVGRSQTMLGRKSIHGGMFTKSESLLTQKPVSRVYVWLTGPDFDILSQPLAEAVIRRWLLHIDFTKESKTQEVDDGNDDKQPRTTRFSVWWQTKQSMDTTPGSTDSLDSITPTAKPWSKNNSL